MDNLDRLLNPLQTSPRKWPLRTSQYGSIPSAPSTSSAPGLLPPSCAIVSPPPPPSVGLLYWALAPGWGGVRLPLPLPPTQFITTTLEPTTTHLLHPRRLPLILNPCNFLPHPPPHPPPPVQHLSDPPNYPHPWLRGPRLMPMCSGILCTITGWHV